VVEARFVERMRLPHGRVARYDRREWLDAAAGSRRDRSVMPAALIRGYRRLPPGAASEALLKVTRQHPHARLLVEKPAKPGPRPERPAKPRWRASR
jgi:hypothetical protein